MGDFVAGNPPVCFVCRHTADHPTCACCTIGHEMAPRVSPPVGGAVNWWYGAAAVCVLVTVWGVLHRWHASPVDTVAGAVLAVVFLLAGALRKGGNT